MPLRKYILPDLFATQALAARIALDLRAGDVLALSGDLGVGKTEFARAMLWALGVTDDVPSPTFTLIQRYEVNGFVISHFDLYRLSSSDELDELGWDDACAEGVCIVEWPERAQGRLPPNAIHIRLTRDADGTRHCEISGRD